MAGNEAATPEVLWTPALAGSSALERFETWVRERRPEALGGSAPPSGPSGYEALWRWSVADLDGFWSAVVDFLGVRFHRRPASAFAGGGMSEPRWFPGATLNYAEQALAGRPGSDLAVVFRREDGAGEEWSFDELRARVAALRAFLVAAGVGRGDRVVALLPNAPHALVALLATASIGAVWSSCSPDFGTTAAVDRFRQIEPVVLLAVDGYRYGGRSFDIRGKVEELASQLPTLRTVVLVDYLGEATASPGGIGSADTIGGVRAVPWDQALRAHPNARLAFEPVPFDHPLWVLYSSGTTGLPKGIVHGHGGIVVEHLKVLALHADLGPGDRFLWFTTTGWMMWNYLVSGLLVGATVVLYDGSPAHPEPDALWRLAASTRVTYLGISAPFVHSCQKGGVTLSGLDLSRVRAVGSTGAPLSEEGFRWLAEQLGADVQIASVSGGTDVCTAFLTSAPTVPVWVGELSCRALGAAVEAYDESGRPVVGEVGELVVTRPMPSMPVFFWGDSDGARMREAYYEAFPGVWRHGDWVRLSPRGSAVIHGRSDSTLNRGGVRMGTSEFYRVVESLPEVLDSLVIDNAGPARPDGELVCFLVLAAGAEEEAVVARARALLRSTLSPRHVPDRFLRVGEVPRTLNGKKCEVPVKRVLAGVPVGEAVSREALANPGALDGVVRAFFVDEGPELGKQV
ncbi:acetoacetate--CoA ligase [Actinoalloteichus sp. AHMU CJ021]|uniref:Acetoacetyl-CoA synthetase n=2 Tax=Actinoalloteichus cyanogriseus TaxID=2893586 RepID=A0ABT1JKV4_ACTCY|nr:acetoacetate--CoA ligase [Actinoalloteichus caeruleus]AUS78651.1 acetoacetate--CoA ligase [Actinoalloteichus sp. AHMU CJ021]MCP2332788.1 acetoacetyl-CoA synthetase [Actinoalloteichus caeruleus DSM 43889]